MKKTDWLADRESFRREWNAAARWNLKYRPNDEETHQYYDELQKLKTAGPGLGNTSDTNMMNQEGTRQKSDANSSSAAPKKRIHIRHKHKRVCPEHAQKIKERDDDSATRRRRSLLPEQEEVQEGKEAMTTSKSINNNNNNNNSSVLMSNRMIRQQPITYTLNERSDELVKLGLAKPPAMLLPGLHIPHVVGAGMCRMLTGGMPANNTRHFERRLNRDYPDFTKCTVDVNTPDETSKKTMTKQSLLSTKRGKKSVNAQDVGGFGTANKMPPTSMNDASEYVHKNHSGGVYHTDQSSGDPLVLRQLHHAMTNRHRQYVSAIPKEVDTRAVATKQMIYDTVEEEDDDSSSSSSDDDDNNQHVTNTNNNSKKKRSLGVAAKVTKLPKSDLIPKKSLVTSQRSGTMNNHASTKNVDTTRNNNNTQNQNRSSTEKKKKNVGEPLQPMLLRIPVEKAAFRKKDDIKTHHESMHTVGGKVMMRGAKAV